MPGMGGYDGDSINIVGPVTGWLDKRRARQEENSKKVSDHAQFVERVAVLHQNNLEMLNQAHTNDLERIKAKSSARRGLVRDAGKIVGGMPTDSTLKVGKVELTRTSSAPAPAPRKKAAATKAPATRAPGNREAAKGAAAKPKTPTKAAPKPAAKDPAKPATPKPPAKPRTKKPQA